MEFFYISYLLIFTFLGTKMEDKHSEPDEAEVPRI